MSLPVAIQLGTTAVDFTTWTPEDGTVLADRFAFDCETTLIDEVRPWFTPAYVIGAATDGKCGHIVERQHLAAFVQAHCNQQWILHHAPFDLAVLQQVMPTWDVYDLVDRNLVWDTQLLHRLHLLAAEGRDGFRESKLDHCAMVHCGLTLPKDVKDNAGREVRTSFDQFLNRPTAEIPDDYLRYLCTDPLATLLVFQQVREKIRDLLQNCSDAFGYIDHAWIVDCVRRWGPLTHHTQLKAAIVLQKITANGLHVDQDRGRLLQGELQVLVEELCQRLRTEGYQPGQKGCNKALQDILKEIERRNPEEPLARTSSSKYYQTSEEALLELADREPFIKDLLAFKAAEKLLSTFVGKLQRPVIHPSFNVLVRSGRTSSFGELNAQNLPRDDRVRNCFIPPPDCVFINPDYMTVEMATLAQSVLRQCRIPSRMADAINAGQCLHRLIAAAVTGKPIEQITKDERQKAKAINFGKPGGMWHKALQRYAKVSYGVDLTMDEVEQLSEVWLNTFPEMRAFLEQEHEYGELEAAYFGLTPQAHFEHTVNRSFIGHSHNRGREGQPHAMLGAMCLKTIGIEEPEKRDGQSYASADINFFWTQVQKRLADLPASLQAAVAARKPSPQLRNGVRSLVDRRSVITLTGRLRANATFCARHNTVFQGLAADGAKLGLWRLWRAGYVIHNFIHDEVLISVPTASPLGLHAQIVNKLMVDGMKEVVPDVRVGVEHLVTDRWSKGAETTRDDRGRLVAWQPET